MKKIIIGFMLLGAVLVSAPKARAITIDDLANQISILMEQISDLKAELSAVVALSRTTTTSTDIVRTVAPTTTTTTTIPAITETRTVAPTTTTATETRTVVPVVNPTNPNPPVNEVRVCKGGGVSLGWVPCGAVTCASMSNNGGQCIDNIPVSDTGNSGTPFARVGFGARNNADIKMAQRMLLKLGYLQNDTQVTGNYLTLTKRALMNFQKENGLKSDGIWGPTTRGILENLYAVVYTDPKGSNPPELLVCKGGGVSLGWVPCGRGTCGSVVKDGGSCKHSF